MPEDVPLVLSFLFRCVVSFNISLSRISLFRQCSLALPCHLHYPTFPWTICWCLWVCRLCTNYSLYVCSVSCLFWGPFVPFLSPHSHLYVFPGALQSRRRKRTAEDDEEMGWNFHGIVVVWMARCNACSFSFSQIQVLELLLDGGDGLFGGLGGPGVRQRSQRIHTSGSRLRSTSHPRSRHTGSCLQRQGLHVPATPHLWNKPSQQQQQQRPWNREG